MKIDQETFRILGNYTSALSVALGHRDLPTRMHSDRVAELSTHLGALCGMDEDELAVLQMAAAAHDLGKIGIPDAVLCKRTRLSSRDWEAIHRHPVIGEEILLAAGFDGATEVAAIVRHHHENFDGSGYPDAIAREAIPLGARVISVVDSYDAMAEPRAYHRQRGHEEIMDVLHAETGNKRDPEIMRLFRDLIEDSEFAATPSPPQPSP